MYEYIHDIMQKGGPLMWPILFCTLAAVSLVVERILYFYFTGVKYAEFREFLVQAIKRGNFDMDVDNMPGSGTPNAVTNHKIYKWITRQQWSRSPYVRLFNVYGEYLNRGERAREEALKRAGSEAIEHMERYLRGLSAIAHISPLLGLLGTVTGIISAFAVIAGMGGQVDVSSLAGGIWEALITTVAGLSVAIPAQLAYIFFEKKVSERVSRMSYTISHLDEACLGSVETGETGCVAGASRPAFNYRERAEEEAV